MQNPLSRATTGRALRSMSTTLQTAKRPDAVAFAEAAASRGDREYWQARGLELLEYAQWRKQKRKISRLTRYEEQLDVFASSGPADASFDPVMVWYAANTAMMAVALRRSLHDGGRAGLYRLAIEPWEECFGEP